MTKVLIIGGGGQLGLSIMSLSSSFTDLAFKAPTSKKLDITHKEKLLHYFEEHDFDYCINCAAYTAVDNAESEPDLAKEINSISVRNIAQACHNNDVVLVHISTDFVFDGNSKKPYEEDDEVSPINAYGVTKLEGEKLIKGVLKEHFIIRTSWLYSEFGNNFLKTMLRLAKTKEQISVVDDQYGSPTYAVDLARVILELISSGNTSFGLYHYCNLGRTSWFQFASTIFALSNSVIRINPVKSKDYKTIAQRPKYSVLNTAKIRKNLDIEIPHWEKSLQIAMTSIQLKEYLDIAIVASIKAGKAIMDIYDSEINVEYKEDESPLTQADKKANEIINSFLIDTKIPIISEENKQTDYNVRKGWKQCWVVDPVDGTKEFIKRNGEFTVNIALVEDNQPILGVIYVPATKTLYTGDVFKQTSHKIQLKTHDTDLRSIFKYQETLSPAQANNTVRVVGSRSHMSQETLTYVEQIKLKGFNVEIVSKGSSLKFCQIAEGLADVYPRFAPTMEWDTAAGQAICNAVGIDVISEETKQPLTYNKENLLNPWFLVKHPDVKI